MVILMPKCFFCGESDKKVLILEKHHVFGRKYNDEMIWACLNCHKRITDVQNSIPTKIRSSKRKRDVSVVALASIGAYNVRVGEELIRIAKHLAEGENK